MSESIQAVVLGASGYVGGELLRLISAHPNFELAAAVSDSLQGEPTASSYPNLAAFLGDSVFHGREQWLDKIEPGSALALFSAAPHGAAAATIAASLELAAARGLEVHVVDASADFRYARQEDYEAVYGTAHGAPALLPQFRSGVPEHVTTVDAPHIGHPGCFATAALLATVPLLRSGLADGDIFVTGTTGSTGSGRSPQAGTHHPERHSNLYAYKPLCHRHAPEIEALAEQASGVPARVRFVPHSGPFARGIYVTAMARAAQPVTAAALREAVTATYAGAPFIDVVAGTPRLKSVVASNRCQLGVAVDADTLVVMSAIDNLVKGAAGGAVQWMNRLWGLPETAGLLAAAPGWT